MADFIKFPSTPHLLWLGESSVRADKVMTVSEAENFVHGPLTIEEKVDGANIGISFDSIGNLLAQNRGNSLERGIKGQFTPLWSWLSQREAALLDALEDHLILFGEWCYARHSIQYTHLPDFFLAFDIFDKRKKQFMSSGRRDLIVREINLTSVPRVASGVFSLAEIQRLIGKSSLYDGPMEGIYLRNEDESWLIHRAKIVRREFVQQISKHWSRQPLVANHLRMSRQHQSPAAKLPTNGPLRVAKS